MLYESQYLIEELGRQRIEEIRKESEEKRLIKMAEPNKSEVKRLLPYAVAFASIVIAHRHHLTPAKNKSRLIF